ncbi:DUF4815 domain-containing protein [Pseudoalteromonas sp. T1lg65]|uniref:DUF4815 domain-containing protein n=1 Tax=Pseudoalteromonas sp. T1lg65 TaxID=2077101 RepID=UPI003F7AFDCF
MEPHIYEQIAQQQPDFYQKFDPEKQYEQLLFRASRGLQSRELNDLQCQVNHRVKGVADALLKDGDIVAGGGVKVKVEDGVATAYVAAASVYIRGAVRHIAERELTIDTSMDILIGVELNAEVITELDDAELKDPAGKGSLAAGHNYDEPGAARLKVTAKWNKLSEDQDTNSAFYPVYQVNQGVLVVNQAPPQLDSVARALARYDREANGGNYVVNGMGFHYIKTEGEYQHFSLQSGKAHIDGFELSFAMALSKQLPSEPDITEIGPESAVLAEGAAANENIKVDFPPLKAVKQVRVKIRGTYDVTREAELKDSLEHSGVDYIESVRSGDNVYLEGTHYDFKDNHIHWLIDGERPTTGSSYQATYVYNTFAEVEHNATHYWITASFLQKRAENNETLLLDDIEAVYERLSPRIDLILLNRDGEIERIKGVPALERPKAPLLPEQHLPLAYVHQHWDGNAPRVEAISTQALNMQDLYSMQRQIGELYQLLSIERLRNDANSQESSSKYGVFVDPFLDDDLRDQGLAQDAAIIDGELTLPIDAKVYSLTGAEQVELLPYTLQPVLSQSKRTGQMKVNPYDAFAPAPAAVTLSPNVDHWTVTRQQWTSPVTRRFTQGSGVVQRINSRVQTQRVGIQTQQAEFLRTKVVHFTIDGFAETETLKSMTFDGVELNVEVDA